MKKQIITAPEIDRLLNHFDRSYRNPEKPSAALLAAIEPLSQELADLKPLPKNDECKCLWFSVPRGDISDFDDYETLKDYGEVSSYDDYVELWKSYYPEETVWYELYIAENKPDARNPYRYVSIGRNVIVSADLRDGLRDDPFFTDESVRDLCQLILAPLKESMNRLRNGTYNAFVSDHLPYIHRTGIIKRSDLWNAYPESKESIFDGMDDRTFASFKAFISENDEESIGRMKVFTANDFFHACAIGYKACGYDVFDPKNNREMTPPELYLRYSDGRDEGLTGTGHGLNEGPGIAFDDPAAWDRWYSDPNRGGGHPWEVCRGGNSTHVDLYVAHDQSHLGYLYRSGKMPEEEYNRRMKDAGYYFMVRGKAWNRSVEAVHFFVSIRNAGYPVILMDAEDIMARFEGTDNVGIVPHSVFPSYCEDRFPESCGHVIDFMHVYKEEMNEIGNKITWLNEEPALLTA